MTNRQQFEAKVRELTRGVRQLAPAARKRVLEMLDEARRRITMQLLSLDPQGLKATQLRMLQTSVNEAMDAFRREAITDIGARQAQAFRMGSLSIEAPLAQVGNAPLALGQISQDLLRVAQDYSADLITNLSQQAAIEVNTALRRAFLGGLSIEDTVAAIGRGVNGRYPGLFSKIGRRSMMIYTTEVLRVHSIAAQGRLEAMAERHPDLKKSWKWIPAALQPRRWHQRASGQVKAVNEPFDVRNERTGEIEELMYPRDPAGSPENTINCHCVLMPHFDAEALQPSPADKDVLRQLGISISVAA